MFSSETVAGINIVKRSQCVQNTEVVIDARNDSIRKLTNEYKYCKLKDK